MSEKVNKDGILDFLCSEYKGISSEAMCNMAIYGKTNSRWSSCHPSDSSDFNRCLMCIKYTGINPEIMKDVSIEWKRLVKNWDRLKNCFHEEAGVNWSKRRSAPNSYHLMKDILEGRQ